MKRAVLYLRVSTDTRSRYGEALAYDQNPPAQERPLRDLAARRGWTVTQVYRDRACGARASRPALEDLLHHARQRDFDVIMMWRFDRLSRRTQQPVAPLAGPRAQGR